VALYYGLVGLALSRAVPGFAGQAFSTFRLARVAGTRRWFWLGASLIACLISSLFLMATSGQLYLQWISAALLVAYAGLQVVLRPTVEAEVVRPSSFRSRRPAPLVSSSSRQGIPFPRPPIGVRGRRAATSMRRCCAVAASGRYLQGKELAAFEAD
jgi:hypothetical protein